MSIWAVNSLPPIISHGYLLHRPVMDILCLFVCVSASRSCWVSIPPRRCISRSHVFLLLDLYVRCALYFGNLKDKFCTGWVGFSLQWHHGFSLGSSGAKWRGTRLYDLIFFTEHMSVHFLCSTKHMPPVLCGLPFNRVPENSMRG